MPPVSAGGLESSLAIVVSAGPGVAGGYGVWGALLGAAAACMMMLRSIMFTAFCLRLWSLSDVVSSMIVPLKESVCAATGIGFPSSDVLVYISCFNRSMRRSWVH